MRFILLVAIILSPAALLAQSVTDPNLKVEKWATGLQNPTGITFLPSGQC